MNLRDLKMPFSASSHGRPRNSELAPVLCSNARTAPLPASQVDPNCMKVILNEKGEMPMSTAKPKELPDLGALFDGHIAGVCDIGSSFPSPVATSLRS